MKKMNLQLTTATLLFTLALGMTACGSSDASGNMSSDSKNDTLSVQSGSVKEDTTTEESNETDSKSTKEEDIVITLGDKTLPLTSTWTELQQLASDYGWTLDDSLYPRSIKDGFGKAFTTNGNIQTEYGSLYVTLMPNEDYTEATLQSITINPDNIESKEIEVLGITTSTKQQKIEKKFETVDANTNTYRVNEYVTLRMIYAEDSGDTDEKNKENKILLDRTSFVDRGMPVKVNLIKYISDAYPDIPIGDEQTYTNPGLSGEVCSIKDMAEITLDENWTLSYEEMGYCSYKYTGDTESENPVYLQTARAWADQSAADFADTLYLHVATTCGLSNVTGTTITGLSPLTMNGYYGYIILEETSNTSKSDSTYIYLYADGNLFEFIINYFPEKMDPAALAAQIQAAMDAISTFTLK